MYICVVGYMLYPVSFHKSSSGQRAHALFMRRRQIWVVKLKSINLPTMQVYKCNQTYL